VFIANRRKAMNSVFQIYSLRRGRNKQEPRRTPKKLLKKLSSWETSSGMCRICHNGFNNLQFKDFQCSLSSLLMQFFSCHTGRDMGDTIPTFPMLLKLALKYKFRIIFRVFWEVCCIFVHMTVSKQSRKHAKIEARFCLMYHGKSGIAQLIY